MSAVQGCAVCPERTLKLLHVYDGKKCQSAGAVQGVHEMTYSVRNEQRDNSCYTCCREEVQEGSSNNMLRGQTSVFACCPFKLRQKPFDNSEEDVFARSQRKDCALQSCSCFLSHVTGSCVLRHSMKWCTSWSCHQCFVFVEGALGLQHS